MTTCTFRSEFVGDGRYRHVCTRPECGQTLLTAAPRFRAICRVQREQDAVQLDKRLSGACAPTNRKPGLVARAASFISAEARWLAAGRPVRDDARVAELFAVCSACEHFQPGVTDVEGRCRLCGCQLRRVGGLINKIQMATEGCPAAPPRWQPDLA